MTNTHSAVARQIREDMGISIGDFVVNYVVKNFSNRWVENRTVLNSILTSTGYQLAHNQVTATMDRWHRDRRYRTDGTLHKHATERGVYMWVPMTHEGTETNNGTAPALSVRWSPTSAPVQYPSPTTGAKLDRAPETLAISIVVRVDGGYIVKIEDDLFVAKKLEI